MTDTLRQSACASASLHEPEPMVAVSPTLHNGSRLVGLGSHSHPHGALLARSAPRLTERPHRVRGWVGIAWGIDIY